MKYLFKIFRTSFLFLFFLIGVTREYSYADTEESLVNKIKCTGTMDNSWIKGWRRQISGTDT